MQEPVATAVVLPMFCRLARQPARRSSRTQCPGGRPPRRNTTPSTCPVEVEQRSTGITLGRTVPLIVYTWRVYRRRPIDVGPVEFDDLPDSQQAWLQMTQRRGSPITSASVPVAAGAFREGQRRRRKSGHIQNRNVDGRVVGHHGGRRESCRRCLAR